MGDPKWLKIVKARKDHVCLICKKPIKKGTEYMLISEIIRNRFVNKKMHIECDINFGDYLARLGEKVKTAETYSVAGKEEGIDIDRVYKDEEDGVIKIMDK